MDEFAWTIVPPRQQHFNSPRFSELRPTSSSGAGISPLITGMDRFDRAVLSWNGDGDWKLEMRLQVSGKDSGGAPVLTPYFPLAILDGTRQRSASRSEIAGVDASSGGALASVDMDTLVLKSGVLATGFQVRVIGKGRLKNLSVAHYRRLDCRFTDGPSVPGAWGTTLDVPTRAQRDIEDSRIGGLVCSPTSMSMILDYHGSRYRTIDVARAVQDLQSSAYGNWPCNTGAVARLLKGGGWSAVAKMSGFDEVEKEIAARRPVALSHRWRPGELSNAPISASSGHLIVAVGFTKDGDVVVNDPASKAGEVRRVYKRRELFHTWQERGEGIAYLVQPG